MNPRREKLKLEQRIDAYDRVKVNKQAYKKPGSQNQHKQYGDGAKNTFGKKN